MELQEARALLEHGLERMNARDMDGILEIVHADARWFAPPATAIPPYEGPEGVRTFISEWLEAWEGFHQELLDLRGEGDRALAKVRVRARGGASGIEFDGDAGYTFEVSDGLIVRMDIFTTYDEALAAFYPRQAAAPPDSKVSFEQ